MKVWAVTAQSESGDDYGVWLFKNKPTQKRLEEEARKRAPGEFEEEDGPGSFGSYLHVSKPKEIEVME